MDKKTAAPSETLPVVTKRQIASDLQMPSNWVHDRIINNLHSADLGDDCVITPRDEYHDFLLGLCYMDSKAEMIEEWIEHKEVQAIIGASRSTVDRLAEEGELDRQYRIRRGRRRPYFSKATALAYKRKKDGIKVQKSQREMDH